MGGKSTKPVVEAADVIRQLSPGDIAAMQHIYHQVAALPPAANAAAATQQQTAQQQQHAGKIEKGQHHRHSSNNAPRHGLTRVHQQPHLPQSSHPTPLSLCCVPVRFIELFVAPRFPSFSAAVHQRVFTVIDYRPDQYIEYDEYLCYRYILDYSTHSQRLHFAFNLFDLNGSGRIDRDKLKRTVAILMHDVRSQSAPPQSAGGTGWEAGREVGGLLELYGYWAMQVYDRDGDRSLRWEEWRQYGEEDDRVRQLCDEMSSRRARRRERLLRQALTQSDSRAGSGGGRVPSKVAEKDEKERNKNEQRERVKDEDGGKRGEQDNGDESYEDEMEDDEDVYDPAREWEQRYLRDTEETGVWEEYRNRMRTAAGRITTHTMESMEGEALPQPPPQQQQHDNNNNSKRDNSDPTKLPVASGRPGSGGGGGGGGGRRSPGPSGMSNSGSASSPILNTTRRNLVTIMTKMKEGVLDKR